MAKVLIIEDHDPDLQQCVALFKKIGVESFQAVTGAERALFYLESIVEGTKPAPLLIVLDLLLGNGSGFEVLRYWKKTPQLANIPVIVWTAVETKTERDMCKMFGVSACVPKGAGNSALLEAVSHVPLKRASS